MSDLVTKDTVEEESKSQDVIIFLPDGAKATAEIALPFIEGSFQNKLEEMLSKRNGLVEITGDEYDILKPLLTKLSYNFKILLGIPGVDSPRSFLSEDNYDLILSYTNLEFTPESETSKFIGMLKENAQLDKDPIEDGAVDEFEDDRF